MKAEQLWAEFCIQKGIDINTPYEVWGFGEDEEGDGLLQLVLDGKKFGTASLYGAYEAEDILDELPEAGNYSVLINSKDEAVCIIKNYDVYIRKFIEVPPYHAYSEGEGDRSLKYWREVHKDFFTEEAKEDGIEFSEESKVVCEKFSLEYALEKDGSDEDELLFIEPSMTFADEITAYRQEMLDEGSSFDGCFSMKRMPDPMEYIDYCIGWANPNRAADEHGAWGNVLMVFRKSDMKMVGCMQVHNVLTQRMKDFTGHVGYSVRPSERRKGYAKRMLARALEFLTAFGFKEVYVSCEPTNIASRKTIVANGGEYIETKYLECDNVNLERYRIRIK